VSDIIGDVIVYGPLVLLLCWVGYDFWTSDRPPDLE